MRTICSWTHSLKCDRSSFALSSAVRCTENTLIKIQINPKIDCSIRFSISLHYCMMCLGVCQNNNCAWPWPIAIHYFRFEIEVFWVRTFADSMKIFSMQQKNAGGDTCSFEYNTIYINYFVAIRMDFLFFELFDSTSLSIVSNSSYMNGCSCSILFICKSFFLF